MSRLQGELLIARSVGDLAGAQARLRAAVEIAQRQQAKSFELRALTSLMVLLDQQAWAGEIRQELATTYGWFTEGHDTVDLRRAQAVLAPVTERSHVIRSEGWR